MAKSKYHLHLKGYVGGYDFDSDYVDYVLNRNPDTEVHVLIDSLGGSLATALSIVAAFRNHGNVHVHFVGMNASAATIASLGAKHVTIDSSAMYLVHKCSMEFFRWASANSDKLADIIKEAKQMKSDLEKMDANVAQMYADKCNKSQDELLALMKKGDGSPHRKHWNGASWMKSPTTTRMPHRLSRTASPQTWLRRVFRCLHNWLRRCSLHLCSLASSRH